MPELEQIQMQQPSNLFQFVPSFLEFLLDFLPTGQALGHINTAMVEIYYSDQPFALHWEWPLLSVVFTLLFTATGIAFFQKRI